MQQPSDCWKGLKGIGVDGAKQQGQRETSLSWKRKIWSCVGKGFLSMLIRKVCSIGMAKNVGKMQCLSKTFLGLVLHPWSYRNKYLLICSNPYLFSVPCP